MFSLTFTVTILFSFLYSVRWVNGDKVIATMKKSFIYMLLLLLFMGGNCNGEYTIIKN